MTSWALSRSGVTAVGAKTDPDNETSKRVLEKCGFIPMGCMGDEGPRFIKKC